MDLITYLPTSEWFDSVFTIVDKFSKYVSSIFYKAICTIPDLAILFNNYIVCKFGMPIKIVSGRNSRFLSKFWKALICFL